MSTCGQDDVTDTSSAATLEIWQYKMITDINCKHLVLSWSLRTKGSLCFGATWPFSKCRGRNLIVKTDTKGPPKASAQQGLLKGILGNRILLSDESGLSKLTASEETKNL